MSEEVHDQENVESDIEPVSNLSASVDISGELLNAAIEIINEPVDKKESIYDNTNNIDSFDELDLCIDDEIKETNHDVLQGAEDDIKAEDVKNHEEESNLVSQELRNDLPSQLAKDEVQNNDIKSEVSNEEPPKEITPSVPVEQPEDSSRTSSLYPKIMIPMQIREEPVIKLTIKAYTEQQLSALYLNDELQLLEQFTNQFVEAELRGTTIKQHVLYSLLTNYLNARNKIVGNTLEIEQLRKETAETQTLLWNVESSVVSGRGECQDGNHVLATHTYTRATFQRSSYQNVARALASIRTLSNESHTLHSYSSEVCKLQVNIFIS